MRDSIDRHVAAWAQELAGLDPIREAITARLAILGRHIGQVRRTVLTESGLKYWQFKVLLKLRQAGPPYMASPSDLAEQLGLTRGALSARLGSLVAAGLVTRTRDTADQRRVHVTLTPAGYLAFERHAGSEGAGEDALLSALSARERTTLANLLRKVVHSLENPCPPAHSPPGGLSPNGESSDGTTPPTNNALTN